jgi:hypothetical protein
MILYLLLAGLIINGLHVYLVWSQREDRKWSISVHAAKNNKTHLLYITGHIIGGFIFLVFAYSLFVEMYDVVWFFYWSCFTYIFEVLQALLPARGKTDKLHTITAYIMWLSFVSMGIVAIFYLPLTIVVRTISVGVLFIILAQLIYVHFNRNKLYIYQIYMVVLFYSIMLLIYYGKR